jgi:hypothetical protein
LRPGELRHRAVHPLRAWQRQLPLAGVLQRRPEPQIGRPVPPLTAAPPATASRPPPPGSAASSPATPPASRPSAASASPTPSARPSTAPGLHLRPRPYTIMHAYVVLTGRNICDWIIIYMQGELDDVAGRMPHRIHSNNLC